MNLLIAPNSFKGCADSVRAANLISQILEKTPNSFDYIELCPISDGGDGFLEVLKHNLDILEEIHFTVPSYFSDERREVEVVYHRENNIIFIESAKVFGLALNLTKDRNPLYYNTVSFGELLREIFDSDLIDHTNVLKIMAGFGGSGTNDLGIGAASVFGLKLFDEAGNELLPLPVNYSKVKSIAPPTRLKGIDIEVIFDVNIPLLGKNGPSLEYSRQKGASMEQALLMEEGNRNIIRLVSELTGVTELEKMNGAAGGTALGLSFLSDIKFTSSRKFLADFLNIRQKIKFSDIIITGEGKFDRQSFMEKGTGIIHDLCREMNKRLFILCGETDDVGLTDFKAEIIKIRKNGETVRSAIENFPCRMESAIQEIIYKLNN